MKRLIFCLACILLCSCDPIWELNPPYNNHLWMQNDSSQELVVIININQIKDDGQEFSGEREHKLLVGDRCYVNNNYDNPEDLSKEELFALMIKDVSCIRITNADKSVVFREFVNDGNEVLHTPFEESSWEYEHFTERVSDDYYQLFNWWYYIITDEDLVVAE